MQSHYKRMLEEGWEFITLPWQVAVAWPTREKIMDIALSKSASRSHAAIRECWLEAVPAACDSLAPSDVAAAVSALTAAVLEALESYAHSRTSDAMISAIASISKRPEGVGPALVSALVPRLLAVAGGAKPTVVSVGGRTLALRAICAALRGNFAASAGTAAAPIDGFNELIVAQGALLHAIHDAARRPALERAAHSALRGMLSAVPEAAPRYTRVVLNLEAPGAEAVALAGVLLEAPTRRAAAAASPSPDPLTEHRSGWVQLYATAVLGASQPPSAHATAAFNRVLCGTSEEEWRTTLLPAATRALKRTPDAAIVFNLLPNCFWPAVLTACMVAANKVK